MPHMGDVGWTGDVSLVLWRRRLRLARAAAFRLADADGCCLAMGHDRSAGAAQQHAAKLWPYTNRTEAYRSSRRSMGTC